MAALTADDIHREAQERNLALYGQRAFPGHAVPNWEGTSYEVVSDADLLALQERAMPAEPAVGPEMPGELHAPVEGEAQRTVSRETTGDDELRVVTSTAVDEPVDEPLPLLGEPIRDDGPEPAPASEEFPTWEG